MASFLLIAAFTMLNHKFMICQNKKHLSNDGFCFRNCLQCFLNYDFFFVWIYPWQIKPTQAPKSFAHHEKSAVALNDKVEAEKWW